MSDSAAVGASFADPAGSIDAKKPPAGIYRRIHCYILAGTATAEKVPAHLDHEAMQPLTDGWVNAVGNDHADRGQSAASINEAELPWYGPRPWLRQRHA